MISNFKSFAAVLQSRAAAIAVAAALFFLTVIALCGSNSILCFSVIATDGVVAFAWVSAACALGSVILRRFHFDIQRSLFIASSGGIGLGFFSLLGLTLGLAGWLNRPVAIALPGASVLMFIIDLLGRHSASSEIDRRVIKRWLLQPAGASWIWLVPIVSLAIACVSASVLPGILWKPLDPHPYDVTSYHLLVPREWYEGGRIVPLDHNVFSYFPFNVEMQFLLLMHAMGGPWAGMYACQFLNVGYAGLMVLAISGMGERSTFKVQHSTFKDTKRQPSSVESWKLNVERWTFSPHIGAAFAAVVPWTVMLAGVAYVESALMCYTALSIAWALHAIKNHERFMPPMILAGVMAGFACGVKITAVPMLLLAVPSAVAIVLRFRRQALIGCVALVIAGSIVLSPWLIRNFFWSGNPLFPIAMKTLGQHHFSNEQVQRFITAHSPTANQQTFVEKIKVLWRAVLSDWEYGFVILPLGLIACGLRWRDRQIWLITITGLFVMITWIGFTHLLPRFLVMMIPIAAIAIAHIQWHRAWLMGVLLLLISAGDSWSYVVRELTRWSNPPPVNGEAGAAFFGLEDMTFMYRDSKELIAAHDRGLQVGLVGDAQAFLYQIPMSHMHYRSVFDLAPGDPIDAWVGVKAKGNPNWLLVINPAEIDRLHRTYRDVPALLPQWAARGTDVFFIHGNELRPEKN